LRPAAGLPAPGGPMFGAVLLAVKHYHPAAA
jgi:hypothetical protein